MLEARFLPSISAVPQADWDRLVGPADSPFNEHAFLSAVEVDSAVPAEGAQANHLTLWSDGALIAALPLYIKGDGRGEFIYDWHWFQFARRVGLPYYPKLLAMSPYTPVVGPRLLIAPGLPRAETLVAVAEVVERLAVEHDFPSVHYLFLDEAEADALEGRGYLRRLTYQPCWINHGYADLDEFLGRFRSKDRVKIKRQVRRLDEQGLRIEVREGDAIEPDDWAAMHAFYQRTCSLFGTGSDYLKPGTWAQLYDTWRARCALFLAFDGQERVGGALCVQKGEALYGRYWGSVGDHNALYFNLAFTAPIRLAIERGYQRFFAGFGNSKTKYDRGLEPYPTHSVHRIFDPALEEALRDHLEADTHDVEEQLKRQERAGKLKRETTG